MTGGSGSRILERITRVLNTSKEDALMTEIPRCFEDLLTVILRRAEPGPSPHPAHYPAPPLMADLIASSVPLVALKWRRKGGRSPQFASVLIGGATGFCQPFLTLLLLLPPSRERGDQFSDNPGVSQELRDGG